MMTIHPVCLKRSEWWWLLSNRWPVTVWKWMDRWRLGCWCWAMSIWLDFSPSYWNSVSLSLAAAAGLQTTCRHWSIESIKALVSVGWRILCRHLLLCGCIRQGISSDHRRETRRKWRTKIQQWEWCPKRWRTIQFETADELEIKLKRSNITENFFKLWNGICFTKPLGSSEGPPSSLPPIPKCWQNGGLNPFGQWHFPKLLQNPPLVQLAGHCIGLLFLPDWSATHFLSTHTYTINIKFNYLKNKNNRNLKILCGVDTWCRCIYGNQTGTWNCFRNSIPADRIHFPLNGIRLPAIPIDKSTPAKKKFNNNFVSSKWMILNIP